MTGKKKEPIVVDPAIKIDPLVMIRAKRDKLQEMLEKYAKEAQASIHRFEGAIAECNELLNDMGEKPAEPDKPTEG